MDGRGLVSELPEKQKQPIDDVIIFYRNVFSSSDGWQTLAPGFSVPPKYRGKLPSPTFEPEIGFARSMLQNKPERKLALINGSKGGTSLRADWKPGIAGDEETQGPCYRNFIKSIQIATEQLQQRGDRYTIRGLLWHQEKSDSKLRTDVYRRRLNELIVRIREELRITFCVRRQKNSSAGRTRPDDELDNYSPREDVALHIDVNVKLNDKIMDENLTIVNKDTPHFVESEKFPAAEFGLRQHV